MKIPDLKRILEAGDEVKTACVAFDHFPALVKVAEAAIQAMRDVEPPEIPLVPFRGLHVALHELEEIK